MTVEGTGQCFLRVTLSILMTRLTNLLLALHHRVNKTKQSLPGGWSPVSVGLAYLLFLSLRFYSEFLWLLPASTFSAYSSHLVFLLWGNICLLSPYEFFGWVLDLSLLSYAFWEHLL